MKRSVSLFAASYIIRRVSRIRSCAYAIGHESVCACNTAAMGLLLVAIFLSSARAQLELQIDDSMTVSIVNVGETTVLTDAYQVLAPSELLDPEGWSGIQEQAYSDPPNSYSEIVDQLGSGALSFSASFPQSHNLAEMAVSGFAAFDPGFSFSIGAPFSGGLEEILAEAPRFRYSVFDGEEFSVVETCLGAGVCEPIPPRVPGDVDGNGSIDLEDFNVLKSNFGTVFDRGDRNMDGHSDLFDWALLKNEFAEDTMSVTLEDANVLLANFAAAPSYRLGDVNTDGVVDLGDFAVMKGSFGQAPGSAAVPEPTAIALAVFGFLLLAVGFQNS